MSKNLIALVIVILIGTGGALVVLGNDDTNDNNNSNSSAVEQSDSLSQNLVSADNPLGLDISEITGPYRLEIETTDPDGTKSEGTIEFDASGNAKTTITSDGQEATTIILDGNTYFKNPATDMWIKYPAGSSDSLDADDVNIGFSQEDLDELNDTDIVDKGTGDCTAGTCRIYESTDPETGDTGTIKIDQSSNRISDIEITGAEGEKSIISYFYDVDITIVAPENATEFTVPGLENLDLDDIPSPN